MQVSDNLQTTIYICFDSLVGVKHTEDNMLSVLYELNLSTVRNWRPSVDLIMSSRCVRDNRPPASLCTVYESMDVFMFYGPFNESHAFLN